MGKGFYMDEASREVLALYLQGRERLKTVPADRWFDYLQGRRQVLVLADLRQMVDVFGYGLVDLLHYPLEPTGSARPYRPFTDRNGMGAWPYTN